MYMYITQSGKPRGARAAISKATSVRKRKGVIQERVLIKVRNQALTLKLSPVEVPNRDWSDESSCWRWIQAARTVSDSSIRFQIRLM